MTGLAASQSSSAWVLRIFCRRVYWPAAASSSLKAASSPYGTHWSSRYARHSASRHSVRSAKSLCQWLGPLNAQATSSGAPLDSPCAWVGNSGTTLGFPLLLRLRQGLLQQQIDPGRPADIRRNHCLYSLHHLPHDHDLGILHAPKVHCRCTLTVPYGGVLAFDRIGLVPHLQRLRSGIPSSKFSGSAGPLSFSPTSFGHRVKRCVPSCAELLHSRTGRGAHRRRAGQRRASA